MVVTRVENEQSEPDEKSYSPPIVKTPQVKFRRWLFWKYELILTTFAVAVPTIAVLMMMMIRYPPSCDMPAAKGCDSDFIFTPGLPQHVLKSDHSASSFLTLARYSTRKTRLRCEYHRISNSANYMKVLVLNEQIDTYLGRFLTATAPQGSDCLNTTCLAKWCEHQSTERVHQSFP
jgi:hypothetical protein